MKVSSEDNVATQLTFRSHNQRRSFPRYSQLLMKGEKVDYIHNITSIDSSLLHTQLLSILRQDYCTFPQTFAPPLHGMICPLIQRPSSELRNDTTLPISEGYPTRSKGLPAASDASISSTELALLQPGAYLQALEAHISLLIPAGAIALTVHFLIPKSWAKHLVKDSTALFDPP